MGELLECYANSLTYKDDST